ncbi:MAG: sulfatase-like hydrolase/transferase, partial [Bacilli bacterium]|nr:sulfatase-like hydrolase/transferase [Bacilli bacterium]
KVMYMNKDSIILLTKDAFCTEYLPCYGNSYWKGKTPNLDELVSKGTIYTHFYTAAPSSAMSYLSMFTGLYPYQQDIRTYAPLVKSYEGETLFDKARKNGFECHVIWDEKWMSSSYEYTLCYGKETVFHPLQGLRQGVGFHYKHEGYLVPDKMKEEATIKLIESSIKEIVASGKVFVWFHLPHVINGRVAYGSDIDLFDEVLGIIRKYFSDDNIYISGDHGNMNGHKGKLGYGFDVYEPAIKIPLITPRKENLSCCKKLVSNIDWDKIIFSDTIPVRDIIISDSAYYSQPKRKTAILYDRFRYIYNKKDGTEELYDVEWDPNQNFNLITDSIPDLDRGVTNISRELYFYPYWNQLPGIREKLRLEKNSIWRDEPQHIKILYKIKKPIQKLPFYSKLCKLYLKLFK